MKQDLHIAWVDIPQSLSVQNLLPFTKWLDADEYRTFERYRVDFKKIEFLIGRLLLKTHLAKRLGVTAEEVHFVKSEYGKLFLDPAYHADDSKKWSFNLTHSGLVVALASAAQTDGELELGIDVEETSQEHFNLMPNVFTLSEIDYVHAKQTVEQKRLAFYELWTRKEAYVKAKGRGLSIPLTSFSVPFGEDKSWQSGFAYYTMQPQAAYILSVAMQCEADCEYVYVLEAVDVTTLLATIAK